MNQKSLLDYVNIRQGTKSTLRFSNGGTQAFTATPFAMSAYAIQTRNPDTRGFADSWFYHPDDRSFEGVRLTHVACNWIGDYGHIVFMPQSNQPQIFEHTRWSGFRPEDTVQRPDYLKVTALRYRYTLELTPTLRCSMMRVKWKEERDLPRFAVLPFSGESMVRLSAGKRRLIGYSKAKANPLQMSEQTACYFVAEFDCDIDLEGTVTTSRDGQMKPGVEACGDGAGINIVLKSHNVTVKIGTSFISAEQAQINLDREIGDKSFEQIRMETAEKWEKRLSVVDVASDNEDELKTFYSCLTRMFMFPRTFYELDSNGREIHCQPNDGTVRPGKMYVDNGFWDTARTVYPFFSLIAPDVFHDTLEGFVNTYTDIGWLPKWPSPAEVGLMPGTYIDAVIADAAVKGIIDGDLLQTAYEGMRKHTVEEDLTKRYGRHGTSDYNALGYLPYDRHHESTNHTLDYIYGDYCIAQVAHVLGDQEREEFFRERAKNYRKIFDPQTGFMRAKDTDGKFREGFNPIDWGGEYTEGSAWQNTFAVYHDIDGLAELYGGKDKLAAKIDECFSTKPDYNAGPYNYELHEMTEMAAVDFGQCAISNQPSFHIPYIYALCGELSKTQFWTAKMCREVFSWRDDGYPGDEDTGTMAGWYLFSSLGFYPFCPGSGDYVLTIPTVKEASVKLGNGKTLRVINSCEAEASREILLNGRPVSGPVIQHEELMNGGTLEFK